MNAVSASQDTFESFVNNELFGAGLWEHEIKAIMGKLKDAPGMEAIRWSDAISGYPKMLVSVVVRTARIVALKWLDENAPKHFARYMLGVEIPDKLPE